VKNRLKQSKVSSHGVVPAFSAEVNGIFRKVFYLLGLFTAVGLIGYGISYLVVMPKVSPGGFVPTTPGNSAGIPSVFAIVQSAFILLYAFSFFPVSVMFALKKHYLNPHAVILAESLLGISLIMEIINNLPVIAAGMYRGSLAGISPDVMLYLRQMETLKYLSYDVAGFTLAYAAFFIYAITYFKSWKVFSYTVFGSILLFIANIPFLWLAPKVAIVLMVLSIFLFAAVTVFLAGIAVKEQFRKKLSFTPGLDSRHNTKKALKI
jgi:hypothetical protein